MTQFLDRRNFLVALTYGLLLRTNRVVVEYTEFGVFLLDSRTALGRRFLEQYIICIFQRKKMFPSSVAYKNLPDCDWTRCESEVGSPVPVVDFFERNN